VLSRHTWLSLCGSFQSLSQGFRHDLTDAVEEWQALHTHSMRLC
jgi:hypothetical protein